MDGAEFDSQNGITQPRSEADSTEFSGGLVEYPKQEE
jgi:hypothetical protein